MFPHHQMFYAGGWHVPQILLVLVVIAAIVLLRRRSERTDRAGRAADAQAMALLDEVKTTLARLEDRVRNLETLLARNADKGGGA